ncbi:hypothetical protein [Bradyrhizobium guangdongense]|uniref:hypothetical protein n=1 Tax=Bradyrhizobium guangdongense TaxID=1325090 RepID=UPI00112EBD52|nr:hypothetical protein [Bradyrhizobium guangdongense]
MSDIIDWPGLSGKLYRYWFLANPRSPSAIKSEAGNYAFVKRLPTGLYVPLYFGIADDLSARIPFHERWTDAMRAGATDVMTHTTPNGASAREAEERDLIQRWNPPLNVHHRSVG